MMSLVTLSPLPGITTSYLSYIEMYPDYTMLTQPLELEVFYGTDSGSYYALNLQTAYDTVSPQKMFNNNYFAYQTITSSNYDFYLQQEYQKFFTLNNAIGPLYSMITPRMAIEGYTDAFLLKMSQTSLLEFGDMTLNPWISIDNASYAWKNGDLVSLGNGEDGS
jgi:hypothetical protein